MVEFPQSSARMIPASERLHAAVVEQHLQRRGLLDLDKAVAAAVARQVTGGRGWKLDKTDFAKLVDAVVCLAMAVERAEVKPPASAFTGGLSPPASRTGRAPD